MCIHAPKRYLSCHHAGAATYDLALVVPCKFYGYGCTNFSFLPPAAGRQTQLPLVRGLVWDEEFEEMRFAAPGLCARCQRSMEERTRGAWEQTKEECDSSGLVDEEEEEEEEEDKSLRDIKDMNETVQEGEGEGEGEEKGERSASISATKPKTSKTVPSRTGGGVQKKKKQRQGQRTKKI